MQTSAHSSDYVYPETSATIDTQIWLERFPLRPTAAWVVITVIIATDFLRYIRSTLGNQPDPMVINWQALILLILLADPLWGGILRMASGRNRVLSLQSHVAEQKFWLPFLNSNSPASHFLGWNESAVWPLLFRIVFPTVLLSTVVATTLGATALWLTGIAILISMSAWLVRTIWVVPSAQSEDVEPPILQLPSKIPLHFTLLVCSLMTVTLPWILALDYQLTDQGNESTIFYIIMMGLWTLHNWGEGYVLLDSGERFGIALLALADIGLGITFIVLQTPIWFVVFMALSLPTWLSIYRGQFLRSIRVWWLLALLVSGVALAQSLWQL